MLSLWLREPHVQDWWPDPSSLDALEDKYGEVVDGTDPTEIFVVERCGAPIGLIQRYLLADNPDWHGALTVAGVPQRTAGIDYLIGVPGLIGQGIGAVMIDSFVRDTFEQHPHVTAIVVSVQQANRRSWRALEKASFERTYAGTIESDDPSDAGPCFVYVRRRDTI